MYAGGGVRGGGMTEAHDTVHVALQGTNKETQQLALKRQAQPWKKPASST
jgi:hypothetical protein